MKNKSVLYLCNIAQKLNVAYYYTLTRHKTLFTNHSQISHGIVSRLRHGIVTLLFIKFRWDDQKRHSIESGIEAEWHSIEI